MATPRIEVATRSQQDSVIGVITLAFSADPLFRWVYADPGQYVAYAPAFIAAVGSRALDNGSAFCIEGYLGAALWLPPGVHPDRDAIVASLGTMPEAQRPILREVSERMDRYHPSEPHWYLREIGVDPSQQNRGLGSLLMEHAHNIVDRNATLAYVESSNPRNIPFYQRYGYELLGTISVGNCPPISPMLRRPKPKTAR
jgi:ribosomal protein S18 acetylase RimI-like enzyme